MDKPKLLILGASSKTGEAIYKLLRAEGGYEFLVLSSQANQFNRYDNTKYYEISALERQDIRKICLDERPNIIINTAAMNAVDECEKKKKLTWDLNVHAVENLARISTIIEAHFITFSTDYIFDGRNGPYTEEGKPNPLSYYGKSKHAGENAALAGCDTTSIIRTNVVYGYSSFDKGDFIRWIVDKLSKKEQLNIIEGQYCNPTFTDDLARTVFKLINKKRYGVYNAAGADYMNRYEIAQKTASVFGFNNGLIKPMDPQELKQKAKRPENGGLVTLKAETDLGIKFSSLDNGLQALKQQLNQSQGKKFML